MKLNLWTAMALLGLAGCGLNEPVRVHLDNQSIACETLFVKVPLQNRTLSLEARSGTSVGGTYFQEEDGDGTNVNINYGCTGANPTNLTVTRKTTINRTTWDFIVINGSTTPQVQYGGDPTP